MSDSFSIGQLTLEFEESGLISDFNFDWDSMDLDDLYAVSLGGDLSVATDYGITIIKNDDDETVYSFSYGVSTPSATEDDDGSDPYYKIEYSQEELSSLEAKFSREDPETTINNYLENLTNNIMNSTTNFSDEFDFNKTKVKKIGFKNLSKFEAQQESTTTADTTEATAAAFSIGSY
jgi:hypothetical protein